MSPNSKSGMVSRRESVHGWPQPPSSRLGRKLSSAGEAYSRLVAAGQDNPIYGIATMHSTGSNTTSSSESSSSRHYVDPWDLENFMYLKRHWTDDTDGELPTTIEIEEGESLSTPALESAQSDFYYVPRNQLYEDNVYGDLCALRHHRPESILMMGLGVPEENMPGLFNGVEEEHFYNERYEMDRGHRLRRSHSSAAAYLHDDILLQQIPPRRRRSVACGPDGFSRSNRGVSSGARYYKLPITGGDSSGESYEIFDDYSDEVTRRLSSMEIGPGPGPVRQRCVSALPAAAAPTPTPVGRRSSAALAPRSRASVAGPSAAPTHIKAPNTLQRRHSHCVADLQRQVYVYSPKRSRRQSFSRGQLLSDLSTGRPRRASELPPYSFNAPATSISDSSENPDPVVDGFTDADLMYAQLASSIYGELPSRNGRRVSLSGSGTYGHIGQCQYPKLGYECNRFQLTNYGHLKIDYSCSWRTLDHYIAHS